jgi:branched-chain amino acid transport system ATP-binding protein
MEPMALFRIEGVSKSFGRFNALTNVTLQVGPGETRAIIGPNGAGKTTLANVVSGVLWPTSGRIYLAGAEVTRFSPQRRARMGLARTFQLTSLFRGLTIAEHIRLASRGTGRFHSADRPPAEPWELLHDVGLEAMADRTVETLSHGDQRILEIAMTLALQPKLLLLDEPTAGMSVVETGNMVELINRRLKGRVSVIIIEHDMKVVMRTADQITVLANGAVAAEGVPDRILRDPLVREIYLGSAFRQ